MPTPINQLDDPMGGVYRNTLKQQELFIKNRLVKSKMQGIMEGSDLSECWLSGSIESIVKIIDPHARNLIQNFFAGKKSPYDFQMCLCCDGKKGDNGIRQFERAHCHVSSRPEIIRDVVTGMWVNNETSIKLGDILRKFIEKHRTCPIYMLCNKCHVKYDKKNLNNT